MGKIKFKPTDDLEFNRIEDLDITNWRAMLVSEKSKTIIVTLESCDEALIKDITQEEFHEINYCNKTVEKSFELGQCWLVCKRCDGSGLTDWITKTMEKPRRINFNLKYDRNNKGEIIKLQLPKHPLVLYISTPKKTSSEEYCIHCHGCGLNRVNQFKILDRICIENC
jgi:ferredoxin